MLFQPFSTYETNSLCYLLSVEILGLDFVFLPKCWMTIYLVSGVVQGNTLSKTALWHGFGYTILESSAELPAYGMQWHTFKLLSVLD